EPTSQLREYVRSLQCVRKNKNGEDHMPKNGNNNQPPKEWTIMVYMEGDNNLADEMIWALQLIQDTSLDENLTLVVLFDAGGPLKMLTLDGKHKNKPPITAPILPGGEGLGSLFTNQRLDLKNAPKFKRILTVEGAPPPAAQPKPGEPKPAKPKNFRA